MIPAGKVFCADRLTEIAIYGQERMADFAAAGIITALLDHYGKDAKDILPVLQQSLADVRHACDALNESYHKADQAGRDRYLTDLGHSDMADLTDCLIDIEESTS